MSQFVTTVGEHIQIQYSKGASILFDLLGKVQNDSGDYRYDRQAIVNTENLIFDMSAWTYSEITPSRQYAIVCPDDVPLAKLLADSLCLYLGDGVVCAGSTMPDTEDDIICLHLDTTSDDVEILYGCEDGECDDLLFDLLGETLEGVAVRQRQANLHRLATL